MQHKRDVLGFQLLQRHSEAGVPAQAPRALEWLDAAAEEAHMLRAPCWIDGKRTRWRRQHQDLICTAALCQALCLLAITVQQGLESRGAHAKERGVRVRRGWSVSGAHAGA